MNYLRRTAAFVIVLVFALPTSVVSSECEKVGLISAGFPPCLSNMFIYKEKLYGVDKLSVILKEDPRAAKELKKSKISAGFGLGFILIAAGSFFVALPLSTSGPPSSRQEQLGRILVNVTVSSLVLSWVSIGTAEFYSLRAVNTFNLSRDIRCP